MRRLLHVLKRDWPRLLIELAVLIAGITISFALEEWRTVRIERRAESRIWQGVHDNLVADSTNLVARIAYIRAMVAAYDRLIAGKRDSVDHDMDLAISYVGFTPTDHAFTEIREGGASRLRNRTLFGELSRLYNVPYGSIAEWDGITRDFVLQRMIPYIDETAPYAPTSSSAGIATGYAPIHRALASRDQFRNLLRTNRLFKEAQLTVYERGLGRIRHTLARVDSTVARPAR